MVEPAAHPLWFRGMPLDEYRRKRKFDVTREPEGKPVRARRPKKLSFVVQKHRATLLHYDLRLEWNGVMLSWAVPKGPCYDPKVRRMARQVEDHPKEYNTFEGIIPAGEYGGGTVMIWDHGLWVPESEDVDAALAKGDLKFTLEGQRLRGSWVLVRTGAKSAPPGKDWLLIKHRDGWVSEQDVTALFPRSVVSDRLLIEIARDEGGDMRKAADGDPREALQALLDDPSLLTPPRQGRKKAVWHVKPKLS